MKNNKEYSVIIPDILKSIFLFVRFKDWISCINVSKYWYNCGKEIFNSRFKRECIKIKVNANFTHSSKKYFITEKYQADYQLLYNYMPTETHPMYVFSYTMDDLKDSKYVNKNGTLNIAACL